jgi:two-component system sensor histidine kinase YesM
MKASFTNLTILQRFIALFILLVVIPVIFMDWIVSQKVSEITERQVGSALVKWVESSHVTIDRTIMHMEETMNKIMMTTEIQQMLDIPSISSYERVRRFTSLDEMLLKQSSSKVAYSFFMPDTESLYSFVPTLDIQTRGIYYSSDLKALPWYKNAYNAQGRGVLSVIHQFGENRSELETLVMVKQMNSIANGRSPEAGYLIASGLEKVLASDLDPVNVAKEGELLILSKDNTVLSTTGAYPIGQRFELPSYISSSAKGFYSIVADGKSWLYAIHQSEDSHTKLLYRTPLTSILGEHANVEQLVYYSMIGYFLLLLMLGTYFMRSILRPISRLARHTRSYEPGKPLGLTIYPQRTKDELEILNNNFMEMTERLNETILDKYELEIKQKEAELAILHSQINPHLLYNTLESIYWRIMLEGNDESAEMIRDLSLVMRIGLSRGKTLITIDEELRHAEAYARLQLKRYDYDFQVDWLIEDEAKACYIPKVVLQPLIENAIVHGIKRMDSDGKLWVSVKLTSNTVVIAVEDNGYRSKDVQPIMDIMEGKNTDAGYGIRNVHKRIQLHFGESYGLSYSLREEGGIRAQLTIPITHTINGSSEGNEHV